jgi:hypothetical protein
MLSWRRPCRFRTANLTPRTPASNKATDRPDSQSAIPSPNNHLMRGVSKPSITVPPHAGLARSTTPRHRRQTVSVCDLRTHHLTCLHSACKVSIMLPFEARLTELRRSSFLASQLLRPAPVMPSEASLRPEYLANDPVRVDSTKPARPGSTLAKGSLPASLAVQER